MIVSEMKNKIDFKKLFKKIDDEEYPQKRIYKNKTIFLIDKFNEPIQYLKYFLRQKPQPKSYQSKLQKTIPVLDSPFPSR